ncbi:hypothetical protein INR49_026265, partial [Caranx melampygus]
SSGVSDLQRAEEADSGDSKAEDGLSSLGSELRAAWQGCWVSVGLGGVKATPGLDIEEEEEMLVLTHSDELSRSHAEDNRFDHITNTYNTRTNETSFRQSGSSLTKQDTGAAPDLSASNRHGSPAFKETRATVISTGPRTVTITSAVSTSTDSPWFRNTTSVHHGKGKRSSEVQADETVSNKSRSHRLAGKYKGITQKQRICEDGEKRRGEERETVEGTPQLCDGLEGERTRMSLADPCQSHSAGTAGSTPSPTITAWEAGWNVTNAIQWPILIANVFPWCRAKARLLSSFCSCWSPASSNSPGVVPALSSSPPHHPTMNGIGKFNQGYCVLTYAFFKGIFVLGLPFALVQSGYVGLVLLVLSAWVCNHTGRILVACLYEEHQSEGSGSVSKVRVRHSYQDVVEACCKGLWPNWPGLGGSVCSLFSLMFLLPCLLLTDLRPVSTLSLLCSLAHILISLLVMLYCLSRASSWSWSSLSLSVDPEDFLVSVGVIIFSYTSQIFLPPLEGSMEDRGQFNAMLGWTHGAACIMKTMFSLLAVLTWGTETSEVITDNLPSDLRPLVNLCLLAKALLSYPLPFYSAAEILHTCLLRDSAVPLCSKDGGRGVSRPALLLRGALLMTSYLLALLVPRFSLLMGLTGSVTGAAMTLILPCLFHLRLRWGHLTARERLIDVGILSLGVVCSVSGVICSVKRLIEGL